MTFHCSINLLFISCYFLSFIAITSVVFFKAWFLIFQANEIHLNFIYSIITIFLYSFFFEDVHRKTFSWSGDDRALEYMFYSSANHSSFFFFFNI